MRRVPPAAFGTASVTALLAALAIVAERAGNERHPIGDLVAGLALVVAATALIVDRRRLASGIPMLAAAIDWFAVTAYSGLSWFGDLVARYPYVHRGLLVHAVVAAPRSSRRVAVFAAAGLGYWVSVDNSRASSSLWLVAVAVVAAACLLVPWRWNDVPSAIGVALFAAAAGPLRSALGDAQQLAYHVGIGIAALGTIVAASGTARVLAPPTGDLVRDGGSGDARIGFRDAPDAPFRDIAGVTVSPERPDDALVVATGGGAETMIVYPRVSTTTGAARRRLLDALRMLRANHDALVSDRLQAQAIAESERRIREADDVAAAELGWALERTVVARLVRSIELLEDTSETTERARASLQAVVAEVRAIANGLTPGEMSAGLAQAVSSIAERSAIPLDVNLDQVDVEPELAIALYFVITEAVTNAARHGGPSKIGVALSRTELVIEDDGAGGAAIIAGGGLDGLRARLAMLGATLDVVQRNGGGTVVTVELPRIATTTGRLA